MAVGTATPTRNEGLRECSRALERVNVDHCSLTDGHGWGTHRGVVLVAFRLHLGWVEGPLQPGGRELEWIQVVIASKPFTQDRRRPAPRLLRRCTLVHGDDHLWRILSSGSDLEWIDLEGHSPPSDLGDWQCHLLRVGKVLLPGERDEDGISQVARRGRDARVTGSGSAKRHIASFLPGSSGFEAPRPLLPPRDPAVRPSRQLSRGAPSSLRPGAVRADLTSRTAILYSLGERSHLYTP